ncbi:MAG: hypothetical protein K1X53_07815 [Candidatus Sumerlaeaceae bacterium]|nr:hypothetical protein [Candidatus Sumerlaeaceae bacterium]
MIRFTRHGMRKRGSAMLLTLGFALICGLMIATILRATDQQTRNIYRTRFETNSLAGAQAVLNGMASDVYFIMNNRPPQLQGLVSNMDTVIRAIKPKEMGNYELVKNSSNKTLSYIKPLTANNFTFTPVTATDSKWKGYTTAQLNYELVSFVRENSESAKRMGYQGAGLSRKMTVDYVPLYQFAIYYNNGDLELHPGPVMDIKGKVHVNGNLWVGSGDTINFHESVSSTGKMRMFYDFTNKSINLAGNTTNVSARADYQWLTGNSNSQVSNSFSTLLNNYSLNGFKPNGAPGGNYVIEDWSSTGNVNIKNGSGTFVNMKTSNTNLDLNSNGYFDAADVSQSNTDNWLVNALSMWGGNVKDASMGVAAINPPITADSTLPDGSIDPNAAHKLIERVKPTDSDGLKAQKFENSADIIISGNPGDESTIKIKTKAGATISNTQGANKIVTVGEFYDGQQLTVVKTLDVNIGVLKTATGVSFDNGVVYVTTTPTTGDTWSSPTTWSLPGRTDFMPAVRIKNASSMPRNTDNAFVVATDRPLYTSGDVNSSNKCTLALAADSITVCSQDLTLMVEQLNANGSITVVQNGNTREPGPLGTYNTKDSKGKTVVNTVVRDVLQSPVPSVSNLVTNAILLMGQAGSQYDANGKRLTGSGGAHNVIRYLENWSSKTHTFLGSIIVLFQSTQATRRYNNSAGYYSPPTRNWSWDSSFKNAIPPKVMPIVIDIQPAAFKRVSKTYATSNIPS